MSPTNLIDLGHKKVAHFSGPPYTGHTLDRIAGVRAAFSECHLAFSPDVVVQAGARLEDGYRAGKAYFSSISDDLRPTAISCFNDLVAVGVIRALTELGLSVPDDVSVVGYDDDPMVKYLHVPLTTVRGPNLEMGARAVELLVESIHDPGSSSRKHVLLPANLVERESCIANKGPALGAAERAT